MWYIVGFGIKKNYMGDHSNLGPVDPHFDNISLFDIIDEVTTAQREMEENEARIPFWQPIFGKYKIGYIQGCIKSIEHVKILLKKYLSTGICKKITDSNKIELIAKEFIDNSIFKKHSKPFDSDWCKDIGLEIDMFEDDSKLQDAILSLHHCYMITFTNTNAVKIIENNINQSYIRMSNPLIPIIQNVPPSVPANQSKPEQ
jgi:hypothetical protein